ncbi:MAG: putative DNA binding domain-containing protein [Muribaculaceae bacterium]|nr:putative DNA binding domain-containing protein [Muribaculaceae bacterium]
MDIKDLDMYSNLYSLLNERESYHVEYKSAKGGLPGSLWDSYSAFANTDGGTIILGVAERNNQFFFDGLNEEQIIKYKKNFWDCAHNRGKVSACIPRESDVRIEKVGESYLLICYIPRANYELRPVYIGANPFGNTFRRNHEGDYVCTDLEVRRMFADAEHDRRSQDGRILKGFKFDRDIDQESFHQYRQTFASLQPTHPWTGLTDFDFLKKIGGYAIDFETGEEGLTMAALMMFGHYESITNNSCNPHFFLDYREKFGIDGSTRWSNRIYPDGLWEANLYQFYIKSYNRLIQTLPRPFIIKDGIRQEESSAHIAVREALINCIIHQDISALGHIIVERTDDNLSFRNPGMMLVSEDQYFEGGRSICRNPILQKMFMRIGRAEKAGSGVDKIVKGWLDLGLPMPKVKEENRPDYVVLTLDFHPTPQDTPQDTHQDTPQDAVNIKEQRKLQIIEFCKAPKSRTEIMRHLGLKDRKSFIETYINPMIAEGSLTMTEPDKPTSGNQKYVTTP